MATTTKARIIDETATSTMVERDGELYFVAQWMGSEEGVEGWMVWDRAGEGHMNNFVWKADSRVEAVDWALGTWDPQNYIED